MVKVLIRAKLIILLLILTNSCKWDVIHNLEFYQVNNFKGQFRIDGMYYYHDTIRDMYNYQTYFWGNGTYYSSRYIPCDSSEFFSKNIGYWEKEHDLYFNSWGDFKINGDIIYVSTFNPINWYAGMVYWRVKILNDSTLHFVEYSFNYPFKDSKKTDKILRFKALDKKPDSIDWATKYLPPVGKK